MMLFQCQVPCKQDQCYKHTPYVSYVNNGRVPVDRQKVVYLTGFLAQLTSTPAMGLNRILGDTLTKLSDDHMLRSWSVYQEQNGCVSVKIKFDVGADAVKHDNMTYKRKSASQVARDRTQGFLLMDHRKKAPIVRKGIDGLPLQENVHL